MIIAKNKVVSVDYTLTDNDGSVLDSSKGSEPLSYIQGLGNIIPGLEAALEGKQTGDSFQVKIAPAEAYGERDDDLMQKLPREQFKDFDQLELGMQFRAHTASGAHIITVTEIGDSEVTVDGNHPLAGVTLNFDVTVVAVREATTAELEHGHAHGEGGHGH